MWLPLSALGLDSCWVWLGDEVLISQLCNISICTRQSGQMNPILDITAWHHMKITAMSSVCQICSCYCDGESSFIICCACLSAPVDRVYWFASAEWCRGHFNQHSATRRTHNRLTFHYLRQRGLKTKNMLRNTALQCNNMTIINRKLVELGRHCLHSEAIVHTRRTRCRCDITYSTFWLSPWPFCIIWASLNQMWSH